MRKLTANLIYCPEGFISDAYLETDDSGRIMRIVHSSHQDSEAGLEFYSGILIPCMINAHCHSELSHLKGAIDKGVGLAGFARRLGELRREPDEDAQRRAFDYWDAKMYEEGVSVVADICNGAVTAAPKKRSRIVYHNFMELFGLRGIDIAAATRAGEHFDRWSITPHSTYSLNETDFNSAVMAGDMLSVHFMESEAERELYGERGELWRWYSGAGMTIDFENYGSPARRIIECVPSNKRIMLVHNVFVRKEEVEMLNAHFGSSLTWVLCPRSNKYISDALPPLGMLRESGARIAIGSDSLASNDSLSMVKEMKQLSEAPLDEVLRWATLSGAEALGLDRELGSIETGKIPGLALLSGIDFNTMKLTPSTQTRRII